MKQFKLESGKDIDVLAHTSEQFMKYALDKSFRVYVGCDSQNKRYGTTYVTVIAYRYGHRGTHYIYTREKVSKIKDRYKRLWGEVERSVQVATLLQTSGYKVNCIDLDFNKKEIARSSEMVAAARGYVTGMGFECSVKPEEQVASRAADHIVRR
jgi:predicted RNase H-related nuclease YkuK (DUF458 family)